MGMFDFITKREKRSELQIALDNAEAAIAKKDYKALVLAVGAIVEYEGHSLAKPLICIAEFFATNPEFFPVAAIAFGAAAQKARPDSPLMQEAVSGIFKYAYALSLRDRINVYQQAACCCFGRPEEIIAVAYFIESVAEESDARKRFNAYDSAADNARPGSLLRQKAEEKREEVLKILPPSSPGQTATRRFLKNIEPYIPK